MVICITADRMQIRSIILGSSAVITILKLGMQIAFKSDLTKPAVTPFIIQKQ